MKKEIDRHYLIKRLKHYLEQDPVRVTKLAYDMGMMSTETIRAWKKKNQVPRMHVKYLEKYLNKAGAK